MPRHQMNQQNGLVMPQANQLYLVQGRPLPRIPHPGNDQGNLDGQRRDQSNPHLDCCVGWFLVFGLAFATIAAVFEGRVPQPPTPLQAVQFRSLLDNHDIHHLQTRAAAFRAPLNHFHMQANMPLFRLHISSVQRRNGQILHGIENVTLCVEELFEISAQEITSQINLGNRFEQKIDECGKDVDLVASMTKRGMGAYKQIIFFINRELKGHEKTAAGTSNACLSAPTEAQTDEVDISKGWHPFLQHSCHHWTAGTTLLLKTLNRLARFSLALQAMRPKQVEGLTPELMWEEVNDRAALCKSFGVVQGNGTMGSRWILAADSAGGEVYLNWYNGVKMK